MRILAVLLLLGLSACGKEPASPVSQPRAANAAPAVHESEKGAYAVTELVTGLEHPWGLAFLPGGDMLVTERPGRLRRISKAGQVSAPITGLPKIFVDGQAGLLDVAVSPTFATDNLVYVSFAEPTLRGNKAGTAVMRGRLQGGALQDTKVVYRRNPNFPTVPTWVRAWCSTMPAICSSPRATIAWPPRQRRSWKSCRASWCAYGPMAAFPTTILS
jgi:glucose/arabinose dehydrogenase